MKQIIFTIISGLFIIQLQAQSLQDFYKEGEIRLVPETDYAQGNNWNDIFSSYGEVGEDSNREIGKIKKIVLAPDGSVFMSHKNLYEIWKFDPTGNLVEKFGEKGGKTGQFPMLPTVYAVLDNQYVFTSDVNARVKIFDLDGNFIKQFSFDFMPLDVAPLSNGKVAIHGHVPWEGQQTRYIIAVLDITEEKYKIIHSEFRVQSDFTHSDKIQIALQYNREQLATNGKDRIYFAHPRNGSVLVYSPDGEQLDSFTLYTEPKSVTDEDVEKNYERLAANIEEVKIRMEDDVEIRILEGGESITLTLDEFGSRMDTELEWYADKNNYESTFPYFSSIVVDSDDNILAFQFTSDDISNEFVVSTFNNKGEKIARASFFSDQYDFSFIPSAFQFYDGKVIAVCTEKNSSGVPLRLMKFSLATD